MFYERFFFFFELTDDRVALLGGDWDIHFSEDCYALDVVHSEGETRRFFLAKLNWRLFWVAYLLDVG